MSAAMALGELVAIAGDALEAAGIVLILGGFVVATIRSARGSGTQSRYQRYRQDLGRSLVLGLEVLVAADIVRTVAFSPTMNSVAALAAIVLIRTFLSLSLTLELEGRWPWQRADHGTDVSMQPSHGRTS